MNKTIIVLTLIALLCTGCAYSETNTLKSINTASTKIKTEFDKLCIAIQDNDLDIVKNIIGSDNTLINEVDSRGYTPFLYAMNSTPEIVDYLIIQGANIHHEALNGDNALLNASTFVNQHAIELLLEQGLDPNHQNEYGETSLILLAARGGVPTDLMIQLAELIISKGGNPDLKDSEGFSYLTKIEQVQPEETIAAVRTILK